MKELMDDLQARAHAAAEVPFKEVVFLNGDKPIAHRCHENVDRYVTENPGYRRLRGWLISSGSVFDKHSVVGQPTGDPFDITPLHSKTPFLPSGTSETDFDDEPRNQIIISNWTID